MNVMPSKSSMTPSITNKSVTVTNTAEASMQLVNPLGLKTMSVNQPQEHVEMRKSLSADDEEAERMVRRKRRDNAMMQLIMNREHSPISITDEDGEQKSCASSPSVMVVPSITEQTKSLLHMPTNGKSNNIDITMLSSKDDDDMSIYQKLRATKKSIEDPVTLPSLDDDLQMRLRWEEESTRISEQLYQMTLKRNQDLEDEVAELKKQNERLKLVAQQQESKAQDDGNMRGVLEALRCANELYSIERKEWQDERTLLEEENQDLKSVIREQAYELKKLHLERKKLKSHVKDLRKQVSLCLISVKEQKENDELFDTRTVTETTLTTTSSNSQEETASSTNDEVTILDVPPPAVESCEEENYLVSRPTLFASKKTGDEVENEEESKSICDLLFSLSTRNIVEQAPSRSSMMIDGRNIQSSVPFHGGVGHCKNKEAFRGMFRQQLNKMSNSRQSQQRKGSGTGSTTTSSTSINDAKRRSSAAAA